MSELLRKKFDGIDLIFNNKPYFLSKTKKEKKNVKRIDIFTIKDNQQEIQQVLQDNNHILKENLIENQEALRNLEAINEEVGRLDEEFVRTAQVTCELRENELEVLIEFEAGYPEKRFIYKEKDYLDDLIDYIDDIHKLLLK